MSLNNIAATSSNLMRLQHVTYISIPPIFFFSSQESVKTLLLQAVGTDPSRLVRISVASLIAKLAKTLFATPQGWQEVGVGRQRSGVD